MSATRIGFTGTSQELTDVQFLSLGFVLQNLKKAGAEELHHGCCVGADYTAHEMGQALGYKIVKHPPDNTCKMAECIGGEEWKPKPYLDRNHDIVDATVMLVAAPKERHEQLRSGTWATVRYATKKNRPITFVWPDGSVTTCEINKGAVNELPYSKESVKEPGSQTGSR